MTESSGIAPYFPESWPSDGTDTFGYPPLETARRTSIKPWRGVRFGDVISELYFEQDGSNLPRDIKPENICAATGEEPVIEPFARQVLRKGSPYTVTWRNMTRAAGLYLMMFGAPMPGAEAWIERGLTNSVSIQEIAYDKFRTVEKDEKVNLFEPGTLTIAVSYVHKTTASDGLLKANEYQISQLERILKSIREHPPDITKKLRLWTDQALSASLQGETERPNWILYGLLPYAGFATAVLHSGEDVDGLSMWSACEQILADGGCGCIFAKRTPFPPFCKQSMADIHTDCYKTIGSGLAVNTNLRRLSGAIHAGVLDETITYHIADAQMLMRLAYYMVRPGVVSLDHAVQCNPCLNATSREHVGFTRAITSSADIASAGEEKLSDMTERINKTNMLWPYPKVRARKGYVSWHGVREFLPTAGQFAKFIPSALSEKFVKYSWVIRVTNEGQKSDEADEDGLDAVSEQDSIVISALPVGTDVCYIVLLLTGRDLFGSNAVIDFSVRLNIWRLGDIHAMMQSREVKEEFRNVASRFLRHPAHDATLAQLKFHSLLPVSTMQWGGRNLDGKAESLVGDG